MKTLLVLGATYFQIPIVRKAKAKGHRVITMDNVPDNPAHAYSNQSANISTVDKEAVLAYARETGVDGIITGGSDAGVSTVGFVCDALDLPGITHAQGSTFTRKDLFRTFQRNHGARCPDFYVFSRYEELQQLQSKLSGLYVIKPVDRSGSLGVSVIDFDSPEPEKDSQKRFDEIVNHSLVKKVILEEFVEGVDLSGDLFLKDGALVAFFPTNKSLTAPPYYATIGHTIPSQLSAHTIDSIKSEVVHTLQALGIQNGPVNFDVVVDQNGRTVVTEMSPRYGGNCIPHIIEYGAGFDEIGASIDWAMGNMPDCLEAAQQQGITPTGVRTLRCRESGILKRITPGRDIESQFKGHLCELVYDYEAGEVVEVFTQESRRIGHVIAQASDMGTLDRILDEIEEAVDARV